MFAKAYSIKFHEFLFNGFWVLTDEWTDGERDSTGARKDAKALKKTNICPHHYSYTHVPYDAQINTHFPIQN